MDLLLARAQALLQDGLHQFEARGPLDWALFLAPLLLLEIPTYYLPLVGVLVARALGLPREDERRRRGFLATRPRVSVVVAGRNEGASIEAVIRSLLEQDYPAHEILVVDDHSEDEMAAICARYARRGLIRSIRNECGIGRTGRPGASNLGLRLANGDLIVSVDADTTFDRGLLRSMVEPFADPRVGVVAGNLAVRNLDGRPIVRLQALEYAVSIDVHKRWADLFGRTLQASGAIGAFRRSALQSVGGWDQELAEDGDLSLRLVRAGWKLRFAPEAMALTDVPDRWRVLVRQRTRWDRGGLRVYFLRHWRLLDPAIADRRFALGMWLELGCSVLATLVYPLYLLWLAAQGLATFLLTLGVCWSLYGLLSLLPLYCLPRLSGRYQAMGGWLGTALATPFYKELLRWVRLRALLLELMRRRYEDSFLPASAWLHAPRSWNGPPARRERRSAPGPTARMG